MSKPTPLIGIAFGFGVSASVATFVAVVVVFGAGETQIEYIDRDVERIVYRDVERIVYRDVEPRCKREHADDPSHMASLADLAELNRDLALIQAPELNHKLTGLSLLDQTKMRVIFDRTRASNEDILEGRADSPQLQTVELVRAVIGVDNTTRLYPILFAEFLRYKRDHARWRVFDPFAQQLFWNISGEL